MACNCGCGSGGVNSLGCGCGGVGPCNQLGVSQNEINTPNCTGQTGVNMSVCGQSAGQLCSCNNCGCQQAAQCVPTPYYVQSPGCQEGHDRILINQQWAMSGKIAGGFAVPACPLGSITIIVPGLMQIMIGSYIQFVVKKAGIDTPIYLKVIAFDVASHSITVQNDACRYGVLSPGDVIPACSLFNIATIVPTPVNNNSLLYPFVAVDFTAPAISDCLMITVTTITGLYANAVVSILGGLYRISTIDDATHITICNDVSGGSGLVPGSTVTTHDASGNYIVPVNTTATNVCSNPAVSQGALLTCHAGVQQPLDGAFAGQVPVLINPTTNEVEFQNLDVMTLACTPLIPPCVSIPSGTSSGTYTFKVDNDPAVFEVGDVVQIIKDGHSYQFIVTAAPVSNPANLVTTFYAVDGTIGGTTTVDVSFGCAPDTDLICMAGCCDQLQHQIDAEVPTRVHATGQYDRTINLAEAGGNWNYMKTGTGDIGGAAFRDTWTLYTKDNLLLPSGGIPAITVPDYGRPGEQYLVKIRGQVIATVSGDLDNAGFEDTSNMLHMVTMYAYRPGGVYIYGEVGSVAWHNMDMYVMTNVEWDGGGHVTDGNQTCTPRVKDLLRINNAGSPGFVQGAAYPDYNDPDGMFEHLTGTSSNLYFAAPIVTHAICNPGENLTPVIKYRCTASGYSLAGAPAPTRWDILGVDHHFGACEIRVAVYYYMQIVRAISF